MSDLISREGLINKAEYEAEAMPEPFKSQLPILVAWLAEKIPSEDPEQKNGKWIKDGHHIQCNQCGISICDKDREGDVLPKNFCPNCGSYNGGEEGDAT